MCKALRALGKEEGGAVQIVEATFVFPIMFIILFFLIFMGNAFYLKAQVEASVEQYALKGAAYCADPLLKTIEQGTVPSLGDLDIQPYRYIFGGMDGVENDIAQQVRGEFGDNAFTFFSTMYPQLETPTHDIAKFHNYVVYSTFSVDVEYAVKFPIRFLGADAPTVLIIHSRAEVPVNDTTEFIRNTDMVLDLFHGSKILQSISDAFGKINDFLTNFASK